MVEDGDYVVLDTSAVIETVGNSVLGKQIEQKIGTKTIALPTSVVAEACSIVARSGKDAEAMFRLLLSEVHLVDLSAEIAYDSSQLYALAKKKKPKFSLMDAIVVMTGDYLRAQVITCDNDFAGMKNVTVVR